MRKFTQVLGLAALLLTMTAVQASGDHSHDHADNADDSADQHGEAIPKEAMFLVEKDINDYQVSFHIMKAKPGKSVGGSHDFMIKVEQAGKALTNVVINTKVIHPNGSAESKRTMSMGDWYMAGYDLGHKGKHQLMILFKTRDGQKHKGGIYY